MFKLLEMLTPKHVDEIPPQFLMTKEEMEDELAMEFVAGELSWNELCDEYEIIQDMFTNDGETN